MADRVKYENSHASQLLRLKPYAQPRIARLGSALLKVRGCSLFNVLPKHIKNAENVTTNCFKKQLDKFLESVIDQPCLPHYYKSTVSNSIIDYMQVMRLHPASHTIQAADHRDLLRPGTDRR